ncbi:hypothetical protein SDRG_14011 [Saprolegnia diclina VS20]|uniref:Uncharacterized protein n=1 Tax=Saprolegnia diclina (strain VS20) TaxID=1156394 RepID=T0REW8_SAPDV|nr:hypothetical protein SDRG_14011 [Saprolegnia diclina VS20]EQC28187.1 hypothetical protein SDRG_14011 [Saprolegnia diclina VS20]|eukprot:XP_008618336.1 hypothetical protein SDRG_14011 [Saprolegnia diclina VS20]
MLAAERCQLCRELGVLVSECCELGLCSAFSCSSAALARLASSGCAAARRAFDDCLAPLTGEATAIAQDATLPKKRQRGLSLRKEIERLRAKRDDLEAQLQVLQSQRALTPTASAWAARAQRQAVAAQHAMHEHARLQELLREQLRLVATLERAFARKSTACNFPCVASWKLAKLGPSGRREDMLRLTQLQYDKLETEWIRRG